MVTERLFSILITTAVVILTLLCMYTDYRRRLIPNIITLPAMVLGLALNLVGRGWADGFIFSFPGLLAGIGLMFLPFVFGQLGGGDVKLMGALGAFLGAHAILNVFLYTTIAGGIFAIVVAIVNKRLISTLKNVGLLAKLMVLFRSPATGAALFENSIRIPYGFAIGVGTYFYLVTSLTTGFKIV